MYKNFLIKTLVLGVVLLFFGAGIISAKYNNIDMIYLKNEIGKLNPDVDTFNPTDDCQIRMKDPDKNYGSADTMRVRNRYGHPMHPNYWEHDILILFDISSIPSKAIINSAKLNIYYYAFSENNPVGRSLTLHKIIGFWDESTVTWNTRPNFDPIVTSSSIVPSSPGYWMEWDVTTDVTAFVSGEEINYGWQIMDESHWGTFDIPNSKFRTKEYSGNGNEYTPYLVVDYTRSRNRDLTNPLLLQLFEHFPLLERLISLVLF
jgi:hypothetical protein